MMTMRADGSTAPRLPPSHDPTVYPSDNGRGEGSLQRFISELLRALLERFLASKSPPTFVGANQFVYYKQFDPSRVVEPDIYILPGVPPGIAIDSWKTWEDGVVPPFALEIVSKSPFKDYVSAIPRDDELGVRELIVFDPPLRRRAE
jgi:Uma2 family endonuclease